MSHSVASISLQGRLAVFDDAAGRTFRVAGDAIRKLYHVRSGSDLWANDEEFWIFQLDAACIVVPDDVPNLYRFLALAKEEIERRQLGYEAVCGIPPSAWRVKKIGFIPSMTMKFSILPIIEWDKLESWRIVSSLSLDEYL